MALDQKVNDSSSIISSMIRNETFIEFFNSYNKPLQKSIFEINSQQNPTAIKNITSSYSQILYDNQSEVRKGLNNLG